jgi:hypothetical protein
MARNSLKDRVTRLEALVSRLSVSTKSVKKKDWRRTLGMFTGDAVMKRIDAQALKYREADRNNTRRRRARLAKS